jgi:hypothetical protein
MTSEQSSRAYWGCWPWWLIRRRGGVHHRLTVILGLAVCAVVAGARCFTTIAEWAADPGEQTLAGAASSQPRVTRGDGSRP